MGQDEGSMLALIRSLSAPLLSLSFMMLASGLFNTFVSLRLELEGFKPESIGFVISCTYLGILIGSLRIDRWISKVGHSRSFVVFAVVLTAVVLGQSVWIHLWYWSFMRLIGGISMAGVFIVLESWLLMQSAPNMRGAVLSVYLAVLYAALSCGQLLIDLSNPLSSFPFLITAAFISLSILPICLRKTEQPRLSESARLNLVQLYRICPHGFIGGVISGMLLAVVYGLCPVYAREVGLSVSEIGMFMAILIFGGFSFQYPMGRWADKTDRRRVLNIVSLITALLGFSIAFLHGMSGPLLFLMAWLFGGFSFTLYPISMAYACERVKGTQIIAATGGFVLCYGLGAIAGPILAPVAMMWFGAAGVFYFLSAITLLLFVVGLKKPSTVILDE